MRHCWRAWVTGCVLFTAGAAGGAGATEFQGAPSGHPNIIFILVDDFAMNLLPYMLQSPYQGVQSMVNEGAVFSNYFVSNSLCCPSRSSIFTGKFPHNTGVFTNTWAPQQGRVDGGFGAFNQNEDQLHTFALALHAAGYRTAMLGKYLNGYLPWETEPYNATKAWKQWGWDEWDVAGNGYPEFSYDLNQNGTVVHYGIDPQEYLTDVLSQLAQDFIKQTSSPFFIEIATFAPHAPYRPAYRDESAYPNALVPRTPAYDARLDATAPDWLQDIPVLAQFQKDAIDDQFRLRTQSVLAVDKLIRDLRATLRALGKESNTYLFFSSDNGYHMGDYSLLPGKMTPFDLDIQVPLVVIGPGVVKHEVRELAQNVDLCPTFTELGGQTAPTQPDGRSLVPLLRGQQPAGWRGMALVEHHGPPDDPADPDNDNLEPHSGNANPPDYEALRGARSLYVEYSNDGTTVSEKGYYDLTTDPYELRNIVNSLSLAQQQALHEAMEKNRTCGQSGMPTCQQTQQ